MLQGTASNVGKSLLCAALCRIFLQDGLRPAPFKAQNMALNSCLTENGEEMSNAQALQALAAGRRPDARMNPVLLKPSSDTGSLVVLLGKPRGHMRVAEYLRYKPTAWEAAARAYDELAAEAGVMVIEGAGSPAEINLKAHDIVNMAVARHARAAVLLVGDIDKGGAFAALLGTWELLDPEERALTAGFILNKFRGDAGLLGPALDHISARTGRPFLGIVPRLPDIGLPEEDSLALAERAPDAPAGACLDIAFIEPPYIGNFTDLDPLRREPDVRLRSVRRAGELGRPQAVVLPDSGSAARTLDFLETSGLARALHELALSKPGPLILGLGSGLLLLGRTLREAGEDLPGLGLLPLHAERGSRSARRVAATHRASGLPVTGFLLSDTRLVPINGETEVLLEGAGGKILGLISNRSPVLGALPHGIFDADAFRRAFLDELRARNGLPPLGRITPYDLNPALDRLADAVRNSLDMARIHTLLGL